MSGEVLDHSKNAIRCGFGSAVLRAHGGLHAGYAVGGDYERQDDQRRWIDVNKGNCQDTDYRNKCVGEEFNTGVAAALFAGSPRLEDVEFLLISCDCRRCEFYVMFSDVR